MNGRGRTEGALFSLWAGAQNWPETGIQHTETWMPSRTNGLSSVQRDQLSTEGGQAGDFAIPWVMGSWVSRAEAKSAT